MSGTDIASEVLDLGRVLDEVEAEIRKTGSDGGKPAAAVAERAGAPDAETLIEVRIHLINALYRLVSGAKALLVVENNTPKDPVPASSGSGGPE